jgi:hypothetical protein
MSSGVAIILILVIVPILFVGTFVTLMAACVITFNNRVFNC